MERATASGRLRVVALIDRLGTTGGAEKLAMQLAMRLDPERFDRVLCATRWPHSHEPIELSDGPRRALAEAGVRFLGLGRRSSLRVDRWRPLVTLLRRERTDILHAHKFGSNVWGVALGRATGVPVIVTHEHTWSFDGKPLRRLLDRELVARFGDAHIAVSRADRERMISVERIPPDAIVHLPNGIPTPPPLSGHDVRAELGIAADAPLLGVVGVTRPQKALSVLVRAAAELAPRFPGLRVLIVGDGPEEERERVRSLAHELGLGEVVGLLGLRFDVPDVLAALDVAVSSSDYEGSPLAVMEYMAAARPIVATRVGGVPDLIDDGAEGRLVPPRDPSALAAAIAELLGDRPRALAMGERARARRSRDSDIEVTVARLAELYERLARERGIRPGRRRPGRRARPVSHR